MANPTIVAWQNKSIAATSDFRGLFIMGLLVAAFWFLWQWLSLPSFVSVQAAMPPLLRFAFDKARFMPDFGLIIAGFAAFHFQRELREEWDRSIARRLYLRIVLPLLTYFLVALILFEAVALLGPEHALVQPWSQPLFAPVFWIIVTMVVVAILLPAFLFLTWTCLPEICWAGFIICVCITGLGFQAGFRQHFVLWPLNAITDFMFGVFACAALLRAVSFLEAVRGSAVIIGWLALLGGSIMDGPGLFFLGFVMIVSGMAIGERGWYLIGERQVLAWSRTALAFVLVQPAVLLGWTVWGPTQLHPFWVAGIIAAVITQALAIPLYLLATLPARHLFPSKGKGR